MAHAMAKALTKSVIMAPIHGAATPVDRAIARPTKAMIRIQTAARGAQRLVASSKGGTTS